MRFPFGETVLLHRFVGQTRNAHGQIVPQYSDLPVHRVAFAPGSPSEPRQGGSQRVVVEPTIYLTDGTVVDPRDQVTVRGIRYEVDGGTSGEWRNPFTGWNPGSAVTLKKVTG